MTTIDRRAINEWDPHVSAVDLTDSDTKCRSPAGGRRGLKRHAIKEMST